MTCGFRHRLKLTSYYVKALLQYAQNSGSSLVSVWEVVAPPLHFLLRVVLHCTSFFVHSLYLVCLVPSMSFSFSLTFLSLIDVNSDKDFGSTLEAVSCLDVLHDVGTCVSERDIERSPSAECSK